MVTKKDLVIAMLATFCLTATLFMIIPTRGSLTASQLGGYDPWRDLNDDGKIDIYDVVLVTSIYDSTGTPLNKTALLLELQSRVDTLNSSLLDLEAFFTTRITALETLIAEHQTKMAELETELMILNATKLGKPDYDSGWNYTSPGSSKIFTHYLNTTNVLVYLIGYDIESLVIHQRDYGGELSMGNYYGAYWSELTATTIKITRQGEDSNWDYIRVMIWKIPEP